MYEALTTLGREDESPLGNVTFESFVSALPLGVPYSHAITVQVDTVRDDTDTGERDTEMNLQFSQQVSHRESADQLCRRRSPSC